MKGQADFRTDLRVSILGNANTDSNGSAIDCKGYEEALAVMVQDTLTGGTSPTVTVKWQESADNSSWADITGAVFDATTVHLSSVVAVVNLTNIAFTIAAQPTPIPARLLITVVDTTPGIVAGTVTIVGTRPPQAGELPGVSVDVTEIVSCAAGAGTYRTTNVFNSVTSITAAAFSVLGGSGDETIKVGVDNTGLGFPHLGRINLINRKRYLRAVNTKTSTPAGVLVVGLVLMRPKYTPAVHAQGAADFNLS